MGKQTTKIFLVMEIVLYLIIFFYDYLNWFPFLNISYLKYITILLCLIFVVLNFYVQNKPSPLGMNFFWPLSLLFTCTADFFLLFTNQFTAGILFFCCVQFCYSKLLKHNLLLIALTGGCGFLFVHGVNTLFQLNMDISALFAAFYFLCLLTNLITAWQIQPGYFSVGLTLLFICDINVALSNISLYINYLPFTFLPDLSRIASNLIWSFYLPAQIIIIIYCMKKAKCASLNS